MSAFIIFSGKFLPESIVYGRINGGSLSVPTNVTATDNAYHNKVGLNWDTIRGATTYRIFRSVSNNPSTATDVGTTAANYFFDTTAIAGQTYFYWVRAENGSNISGFSLFDQGVRAIGNLIPGAFNVLNPPNAPSGNEVTACKSDSR